MNNKFVFRFEDDTRKIEHTIQEIPWPEVLDQFVDFLRGVGYHISQDRLSSHFWIPESESEKEEDLNA